ncbi:MAG: RDD family protein [Candidatus Viridilinea halotolerans]|uniref:RDD family protein n=1 Tax=Candidatus Viridilinea halotolerans TaxID=2491704 RepID=A0A426TU97_9CHLR|nr:MAG: RDD family protein [Candidatus Viridilinea halotolerans]
MPNSYIVETPEVVNIHYTVAGVGSRCLAATVDTCLLLLLHIGMGTAFLLVTGLLDPLTQVQNTIVLALWSAFAFALTWGFYMAFELLWSGQTPGKRLFGLRVIREGGRPLDASAAALRNLIRAVDLLPFAYGLGVLTMIADRHARRLGDLAAGTLVVREGSSITLHEALKQSLPAPVPPRAPEAPTAPLLANLHLARPADYALAERFLLQRTDLRRERRRELAHALASALRERLGNEVEGHPERFIEHFVREYRVFHRL